MDEEQTDRYKDGDFFHVGPVDSLLRSDAKVFKNIADYIE